MKTAAQLFPLSLFLSILFLLIYNPKQYRHSTEHFFFRKSGGARRRRRRWERERKRRIRKERKIRKNLRFSVCSCSYYFPSIAAFSCKKNSSSALSLTHNFLCVFCLWSFCTGRRSTPMRIFIFFWKKKSFQSMQQQQFTHIRGKRLLLRLQRDVRML